MLEEIVAPEVEIVHFCELGGRGLSLCVGEMEGFGHGCVPGVFGAGA